MQKGTVLYLADAKTLPDEWEDDRALAECGLDPAWTELAAHVAGFPSPQEAQLRLAVRGAARIDGAHASHAEGRLRVSPARLRLRG